MSATRFNDAVLALLGLYQAAPAFEGIPVYDGPVVTGAADEEFLVVGHDGSLAADGTFSAEVNAGTVTQQDIAMGPMREESGLINCALVCQSGETTVAARRQRASDLLAAAEDAAAANGALPTDAPGVMFTGTASGRWVTRQTAGGAVVIVAYRVAYSTEW